MDSKFELRLSDTLQNTIDSSVDQICGVHLQATELELSSALPHNVNGTLEQYAGIRSSTPITDFQCATNDLPISPLVKTALAQQNVIDEDYYTDVSSISAGKNMQSEVDLEVQMPVDSQSFVSLDDAIPMNVNRNRNFLLISSSSDNEQTHAMDTSNKRRRVSTGTPSKEVKHESDLCTEITKFSFNLTSSEYSSIKPVAGSNSLSRGWNTLMYSKFHKFWPSCAIVFNYNHCRKETSRKQKAPFWVGRGLCRTRKCVNIELMIESPPELHANVAVDVTVKGKCTHKAESGGEAFEMVYPNRRFLAGKERLHLGSECVVGKRSAQEKYHESMAFMTDEECKAGNKTACQTPNVIRQAIYEFKKKDRLHDDMIQEVNILRRGWISSIKSRQIHGFVQGLGLEPLYILWYLEAQLDMYIKACKSEGCVLHFDSTGSIVKESGKASMPKSGKIPKTYYYSMLIGKTGIPAFEFVTTRHDSDWITGRITMFLRDVRKLNSGCTVRPLYVVTDFSFPLIYSTLIAYNRETLVVYLKFCFEVMKRNKTEKDIQGHTYVVLCSAHILKALAMRLTRKENDKRKRKTVLTYFACIQRSQNLGEALRLYRNVHISLCSKTLTSQVLKAQSFFEEHLSTVPNCVEDIDTIDNSVSQGTDNKIVTEVFETKETLKKYSPFNRYFNRQDMTVQDSDDGKVNTSYSPNGFQAIQDLMYAFPLWAAALQSDILRFALNESADCHKSSTPVCYTNGKIESYFNFIKHNLLRGQLRLRPGDFLCTRLTDLQGLVNEQKMPIIHVKHRAELSGCEEKWAKKRKRSTYTDKESSLAHLRKLRTDFTPKKKPAQNSQDTPVTEIDLKLAMDTAILSELDSDDIDKAQAILREKFAIGGLQDSVLGPCIKGKTMPKFRAEDSSFVQILNVGDHWVCITNKFTNNSNNVYIYDSLYNNINQSAIVQTTSLLRKQESSDFINFHMRKFSKQNASSRLCGFYAVAAAISVCNGIDPSGIDYDEFVLVEGVRSLILHNDTSTIEGVTLEEEQPSRPLRRKKKHCICHSFTSELMIQCSSCSNWFHEKCVQPSTDALINKSRIWLGPCCSNYTMKQLTGATKHKV